MRKLDVLVDAVDNQPWATLGEAERLRLKFNMTADYFRAASQTIESEIRWHLDYDSPHRASQLMRFLEVYMNARLKAI
jgi:hypothetical protein